MSPDSGLASEPRRHPARTVGRFVLATLLALAALEGGLRIYTGSAQPNQAISDELHRLSDDPVLGWELRPSIRTVGPLGHRIEVNSAGFRGPEVALAKKAGVQRVAVLGDSEAFGEKVAAQETLPGWLERLLVERDGPRWEVLNFGVEGYDTRQETQVYRTRAKSYSPDVVLLYYVSNDTLPDQLVRRYDEWDESMIVRRVRDLALTRRAARLFHDAVGYQAYVEQAFAAESPQWRESRESILGLAHEAEANGSRFVLVVSPELFGIRTPEQLRDTPYRAFHEALARLRSDSVKVVDPLPALRDCAPSPTELWVAPDDQHKNGRTNRCIARSIVREAFPEAADHTDPP